VDHALVPGRCGGGVVPASSIVMVQASLASRTSGFLYICGRAATRGRKSLLAGDFKEKRATQTILYLRQDLFDRTCTSVIAKGLFNLLALH